MKRTVISLLLLVLCGSAFAQDKVGTLKPYGFVRNYFAFDTRESVAGTEDFFFYVPKDVNITSDGTDLNEQPTFRFAALTSRLWEERLAGHCRTDLASYGRRHA